VSLVDAAAVAEYLAVERSRVYEHTDELAAGVTSVERGESYRPRVAAGNQRPPDPT
jgi:hypothetical protein